VATWGEALARTRSQMGGIWRRLFAPAEANEQVSPEELEQRLLAADVPVRLASELVEDLEQSRGGSLPERLRKSLLHALGTTPAFAWRGGPRPLTLLMVGVNGSGKTTTCAKLAHQAIRSGARPILGATDTFRAAGADQLRLWAANVGCDVVAGKEGSDAAAVAFDALDAAIARDRDALIVDTAGRMHTRQPLMKELEKVRGSLAKRLAGAPHETWVVLDATLGQNAVNQARVFHEAVPLTGAVIAKLDGSAKAGFVFSVTRELGIPVRFVGLGESREDLVPFDPGSFVDGLLGLEPKEQGA
jgi:fused signal recognition particle receptor